MLDKLNQPKGSTIGVLRDGRSIQEAFDNLDKGVVAVTPSQHGAVQGEDATSAINNAAADAASKGLALDLRGGPWTVSGTIDLSGVKTVISDSTGQLKVNTDNFKSKFTNKFAVTFGNPDVAFGQGRVVHSQVIGTLVVSASSRGSEVHGVYMKGSWFNVSSLRVTGFNGSGVVMAAVWDSIFGSISAELCGNTSNYQIDIKGDGDTSNCIFIGRIQSERAYHKCLRINAIRSVFNTIHAERTAILTTDDGSSLTDTTIKYTNFVLVLGNSVVNQLIHDAISGNAPDGTATASSVASVRLDLDFSTLNAAALGSCLVTTNSGRCSTYTGMVAKKWTLSDSATNNVVSGVRISELLSPASATTFTGGTATQVSPRFNAKDLVFDNMDISQLTFPSAIKGNIRFRACRFPASATIASTQTPTGYSGTSTLGETNLPVTFENCVMNGKFTGAFQSRAVWIGGFIATVELASRAAVEFYGVSMGSFKDSGDIGYVTRQCKSSTVVSWNRTTHIAYPIGTVTERLGVDSASAGLAFRNLDGTTSGWSKIY